MADSPNKVKLVEDVLPENKVGQSIFQRRLQDLFNVSNFTVEDAGKSLMVAHNPAEWGNKVVLVFGNPESLNTPRAITLTGTDITEVSKFFDGTKDVSFNVEVLNSAKLDNKAPSYYLDLENSTGMLSPEQVPGFQTTGVVMLSSDIPNITPAEEAKVEEGVIVFESDGSQYVYSSGPKDDRSSYIALQTVFWNAVANKPNKFPPEPHTHGAEDLTDVSEDPGAELIPQATPEGTIKSAWVNNLDYKLDQLLAQQWANKWPGIPAPSFYQEFGGGASILDPRITFTRASDSWYFKDGVLVKADVNEPVFENGVLRLEPSATNLARGRFDSSTDVLLVGTRTIGGLTLNIYEGSGNNTTAIFSDGNNRFSDTDIVTASIFVMKGTQDYIGVGITGTTTSTADFSVFKFSTATFLAVGNNVTASALYVGFGVWRISLTLKSALPVPATRGLAVRYNDTGTGIQNSGLPDGEQLIIGGVQIELGTRQTSYVPIAVPGTNVTRAADDFSITGQDFADVFNPAQGALVFKIGEGSALIGGSRGINFLGAGIAWLGLYNSSGAISGRLNALRVSGGGTPAHALIEGLNITPGSKIAVAWKGPNWNLTVDGLKVGDGVDPDVPEVLGKVTFLKVEKELGINLPYLMLFKSRPSDEQLEALTAND